MLPSMTDRTTNRAATVTRGEIAIQTSADTYGVDRKVSKIDTETHTHRHTHRQTDRLTD